MQDSNIHNECMNIDYFILESSDLASTNATLADVKNDIGKRNWKTYYGETAIGGTSESSIQVLCNLLPDMSTVYLDVGELTSTGWKSQLPTGFGLLEITRYFSSRVVVKYYPTVGTRFYIGYFTSNTSPNWKGFYMFSGAAT